jgi:hypothetical protein
MDVLSIGNFALPVSPSSLTVFVAVVAVHRASFRWRTIVRTSSTSVTVESRNDSLQEVAIQIIKSNPYDRLPLYALVDAFGTLSTLVPFNLKQLVKIIDKVCSPDRLYYHREELTLADGGTIALDWAYRRLRTKGSSDVSASQQPQTRRAEFNFLSSDTLVLINHGLGGDSEAEYIVHLVRRVRRPKSVYQGDIVRQPCR